MKANYVICDRCAREISDADAETGTEEYNGLRWDGATLCPDCVSETHFELIDRQEEEM